MSSSSLSVELSMVNLLLAGTVNIQNKIIVAQIRWSFFSVYEHKIVACVRTTYAQNVSLNAWFEYSFLFIICRLDAVTVSVTSKKYPLMIKVHQEFFSFLSRWKKVGCILNCRPAKQACNVTCFSVSGVRTEKWLCYQSSQASSSKTYQMLKLCLFLLLLYKRNRRICITLETDITLNKNNNNMKISLFRIFYHCCRELHFTIWFEWISNDYRSMVNGIEGKWQKKMIHKREIPVAFLKYAENDHFNTIEAAVEEEEEKEKWEYN